RPAAAVPPLGERNASGAGEVTAYRGAGRCRRARNPIKQAALRATGDACGEQRPVRAIPSLGQRNLTAAGGRVSSDRDAGADGRARNSGEDPGGGCGRDGPTAAVPTLG